MKFSRDFFKEEYRNDFLVPEMMKRAWAAKLELLQIVIDICRKHKLTYFADYGTLLGAIRHKGFIPWDDDIDISLKRPDYNKLISLLPDELPDGIALAGLYAKNDAQFVRTCQSIVVTVASAWKLSDYMQRFHGFPYRNTGIDIFPLDYFPDDPKAGEVQRHLVQKIFLCARDWAHYDEKTREMHLDEIESLCNVRIARNSHIPQSLLQLQDSMRALYTESECSLLADDSFWLKQKPAPANKEWYNETVAVPFENLMIDVPVCYPDLLRYHYGDYMTPVMFTSDHTYPFYAPEERALRSYLDSHGYKGSIDDFVREHYTD